jgi:hypothetical protein
MGMKKRKMPTLNLEHHEGWTRIRIVKPALNDLERRRVTRSCNANQQMEAAAEAKKYDQT